MEIQKLRGCPTEFRKIRSSNTVDDLCQCGYKQHLPQTRKMMCRTSTTFYSRTRGLPGFSLFFWLFWQFLHRYTGLTKYDGNWTWRQLQPLQSNARFFIGRKLLLEPTLENFEYSLKHPDLDLQSWVLEMAFLGSQVSNAKCSIDESKIMYDPIASRKRCAQDTAFFFCNTLQDSYTSFFFSIFGQKSLGPKKTRKSRPGRKFPFFCRAIMKSPIVMPFWQSNALRASGTCCTTISVFFYCTSPGWLSGRFFKTWVWLGHIPQKVPIVHLGLSFRNFFRGYTEKCCSDAILMEQRSKGVWN